MRKIEAIMIETTTGREEMMGDGVERPDANDPKSTIGR